MERTTVDVTLRVVGLNLESSETDELLAKLDLPAVWEEQGDLVLLTLTVASEAVLDDALHMVRRLEAQVAGAKVEGVDRDLVSASDIAMRVDLSREAVRKWVLRDDFPKPYAVITGQSVKIWAWTQVVDWLVQSRRHEVDESLLTLRQMTQLENCIMGNPDSTSIQWQTVNSRSAPQPVVAQRRRVTVRASPAGSGHSVTRTSRRALVGTSSRGL